MNTYKGFKVGDTVTVKQAERAYYSGHAGIPKQEFTPQHIGVIKSFAPFVRASPGNGVYFAVIDFHGDKPMTPLGSSVWRVGVSYKNLVRVGAK